METKLSLGATALLDEVEQLYGCTVVGEIKDFSDGRFGNSKVDPDGTPRLSLSSANPNDEEVIVHELFHFKLRAQGAPIFGWKIAKDEDYQQLLFLQQQIYDAIQHRAFAEDMKTLGLNPASKLQARLKSVLKERRFSEGGNDAGRAVVLARIFLEFGDGDEFAALKQWYRDEGWNAALSLGAEMLWHLRTPFKDSTKYVIQFLSCVRVIGFPVVLEEYRENMLGRHREIQAVVSFESPQGSKRMEKIAESKDEVIGYFENLSQGVTGKPGSWQLLRDDVGKMVLFIGGFAFCGTFATSLSGNKMDVHDGRVMKLDKADGTN